MTDRLRASLRWGIVSALAFLVLLQGYVLAGGEPATLPVAGGVAVLVGLASAALTWAVGPWLDGRTTNR